MNLITKDKNLITLEEAAKYIGVSVQTFRQNYSNRLNDVKYKMGKRVYFPRESMERFLRISQN